MSSLSFIEENDFEELLGMSTGYVLSFNNPSFRQFFIKTCQIDIYDAKYANNGESKANRLRTFWSIESDALVAKAMEALLQLYAKEATHDLFNDDVFSRCDNAVRRLQSAPSPLVHVQQMSFVLDSDHIHQHVKRMQDAIESDPDQAIGSAKEFVESIAKTILIERNALPNSTKLDVRDLVKACMKELALVPDSIPNERRGADAIKLVLNNLRTVVDGLDELRNLYGTGHGRASTHRGLTTRHAKLAVGAAATLGVFLFETHLEKPVIATKAPSLNLVEASAT